MTNPKPTELLSLLRSGRAVMETKRLAKGAMARDIRGNEVMALGSTTYAVDPLGALLIAAVKHGHGIDVYAKSAKLLSVKVGLPITTWSDDPARTHRDVVELMKKVVIEFR